MLQVDGNEGDRRSIRGSLERYSPVKVHSCKSAEEALEEWGGRLTDLDIVILDHSLPGMTGLDFCSQIRAVPGCPPVVVLTDRGSEEVAANYLRLGVHEYLIKDLEGRVFGTLPLTIRRLVWADRLERRELERQRRQAEEGVRRKALLDSLPLGAIFLDRERRVVEINRAALAMTGAKEEDCLGIPCEEVFPVDICGPGCPMAQALSSGRTVGPLECNLYRGGVKVLPLRYSAAPVTGPEGEVLGGVAMFDDITDRLALERERATFLSMLVHDMKTPLVGIKGFARLLTEKGADLDGDKRREYAEVILGESERLERLAHDFLSSARQGRAELNLDVESADLLSILKATGRLFSSERNQQGQDVILDLPPHPLITRLDKGRMQQVLGNLLENALRHSPPGGAVTLRARHQGGMSQIEVVDQGPGIHPDDLPHIFRPYFQGRSKRAGGGFGLGLAGVKAIVEAHGGVIRAHCPPSGGTVFTLELPLADPGLDQVSN